MIRPDDVIVYDEEYKNAAIELKNYCDDLGSLFEQYHNIMLDVTDDAINDKLITENVRLIAERVIKLQQRVEGVGENISEICNNFVTEVDEADKFLY